MYPHERSLVKKLADMPFALLGVNSDKDIKEIREITREKNISWRSFWSGEEGTRGPIPTEWGVRGWPTIFLIDAEGVIRHKGLRGKQLDKALTEMMAELGYEVDLSNDDAE